MFVIDAFSDDAIPVHLLTKEAFDTYQKHLNPSGLIAIHISTSYVNLQAPMVKLAEHFGMHLAIIQTTPDGHLNAGSRWALLTNDKTLLSTPAITKAKKDLSDLPEISLWTDDYSNLFQLMQK